MDIWDNLARINDTTEQEIHPVIKDPLRWKLVISKYFFSFQSRHTLSLHVKNECFWCPQLVILDVLTVPIKSRLPNLWAANQYRDVDHTGISALTRISTGCGSVPVLDVQTWTRLGLEYQVRVPLSVTSQGLVCL